VEKNQSSSDGVQRTAAAETAAPKQQLGCPMSRQAESFDPFESEYQLDPAEALRWSRAQEPVFFCPKLGYWVVSRYADIKEIFRDNQTFSPSIALEKIMPASPQAQEVLARYGYAMNRTLVNEDEPQHTERRRALISHFAPEELAHNEVTVRQLTGRYIDRFVDRGQADLVNEMLWEIPLTVALSFLGVPEEDMDSLREFSIAHTVNTWGRPTPAQQLEVAEAVGRFWQYAGGVLAKMREEPEKAGWMRYAIRRQKDLPDVVTDSYLHSMMMAIIVAAHETTAHASANMFRRLLENRELWNDICRDPSLIPNAVEECLRHSGSVVAWRRLTTQTAQVGDVTLAKGAKLLMVTASGNHDERHFENPDVLDLYRDNAADHLTFGYGSHQCMGKNLARMEMRIFLEELTARLPHMELVPDQQFTFLPNTSFRGPDHLRVRWDPADNPERMDRSALERRLHFEVGAPNTKNIARSVRVVGLHRKAHGIVNVVLADPRGRQLPQWTAGAHVDLLFAGYERKYSLCGNPEDSSTLQISILREELGRGGSAHLHSNISVGDELRIRGPKNYFRLDETAEAYILIAGGIGITPIIAMADRLKRIDKPYRVYYSGKSSSAMAFVDRLRADHGGRLTLYRTAEGKNERMDLGHVLGVPSHGRQIYVCGPERMIEEVNRHCLSWPQGTVHVEHFSSARATPDSRKEESFEASLKDSKFSVVVAPGETLLHSLRAAGIDVASDCEEGLCGSCEVPVLGGEIDHRDKVLSSEERSRSIRMMACCSRGKGRIELAL
jgi:cytochrome P450/ferredoxin-NADP reductase